MNRYNVWKVGNDGYPIEGSDRIFVAKSARWIIRHIAHEEKVDVLPRSLSVKLPSGEKWYITILEKNVKT